MAIIIDGKGIASKIKAKVKQEVSELREHGVRLKLEVILIGDDPASEVYIRNKEKALADVGIDYEIVRLPKEVSEPYLIELIRSLNNDQDVDGILVQMPIPEHISPEKVMEAISPYKDVDGFHPYNLGLLASGRPFLVPCTARGILTLIEDTKVEISGKLSVVVGRSLIVGKPISLLLLSRDATVTICHSKTNNLKEMVEQADILVVAVGKPRIIKGDWIKKDAIVIDVGVNRMDEKTLVGDVDFEVALQRAGFITPVPGGVGPMTIAYLLENTLKAGKRRRGIR